MTQSNKKNSEAGEKAAEAPKKIIPKITPRCTLCGDCLTRCPTKSIFVGGNQAVIDTDTCQGCHVCVSVCNERAIVDQMGGIIKLGER